MYKRGSKSLLAFTKSSISVVLCKHYTGGATQIPAEGTKKRQEFFFAMVIDVVLFFTFVHFARFRLFVVGAAESTISVEISAMLFPMGKTFIYVRHRL